MAPAPPESVVVHPLVLLSVVDHYTRVAKDTRKRVVGVVLGEVVKGVVEATNSFAVPFEEDDKDPSVWFLDHSYLENMARMFKKVAARERVVGWYHTGPRLRPSDADIAALVARHCDHPVLLVCEVAPREVGLPVHAYALADEAPAARGGGAGTGAGAGAPRRVFANLPTSVGASEAEEIGVEHLLRDVKDAAAPTLGARVADMAAGLRGLRARLAEVGAYLDAVLDGRLPLNHDVLAGLQGVVAALPAAAGEPQIAGALQAEANDSLAAVYAASLARAVLALHALIENKEARALRERERADAAAKGGKDGEGGEGGKDGEPAAKDGGGKENGTKD